MTRELALPVLDELMDGDDCDCDHLVCGCRPTITMCGIYDPAVTFVRYAEICDDDCPACVQIWSTRGCGACGCRADWSCEPCVARYYGGGDDHG